MHRARLVSVCVLALAVVSLAACSGSNPAAPSTPPPPVPTTAQLSMRLDAACFSARQPVHGADLFVDGRIVQAVNAGGTFTMTVTIGTHIVEATAYYSNGVQGEHWGPWSVSVPAAGYTQLFYCA